MPVSGAFTSALSPADARAVLTREIPAPPRLRFRFDGRITFARAANSDGSLTVWQVPGGLRSPLYVAEVRIRPEGAGSRVEITYRAARSRVLVSAASGLVMALIFLAAIALLPAPPPASPRYLSAPPLPAPLVLSLAVLVLVVVRFVRRQRVVARDLVTERLPELLA